MSREGEVMFGNDNASATRSPSSPAHAGDPVRRGFSAQARLSLEYWIARSKPGDHEWRVPACNLKPTPTPSLRGALATKQSIEPRKRRNGLLRFARNDELGAHS